MAQLSQLPGENIKIQGFQMSGHVLDPSTTTKLLEMHEGIFRKIPQGKGDRVHDKDGPQVVRVACQGEKKRFESPKDHLLACTKIFTKDSCGYELMQSVTKQVHEVAQELFEKYYTKARGESILLEDTSSASFMLTPAGWDGVSFVHTFFVLLRNFLQSLTFVSCSNVLIQKEHVF